MEERNKHIEEHYRENFKRIVNSLSGSHSVNNKADAQDIVHETYANVIEYYHTYDHKRDFEAWFHVVLFNQIKAYISNRDGINRSLNYDSEPSGINTEENWIIQNLLILFNQNLQDPCYLIEKWHKQAAE